MSQPVQAIVVGLLVWGLALLWEIGGTLETQNRILSQILASLAKLEEIRAPLNHVRLMLMDGDYRAPKPPPKTVEAETVGRMVLAQHEIDKLGQR